VLSNRGVCFIAGNKQNKRSFFEEYDFELETIPEKERKVTSSLQLSKCKFSDLLSIRGDIYINISSWWSAVLIRNKFGFQPTLSSFVYSDLIQTFSFR